MDLGPSLAEWTREQPLSILQLDPADRAVLRIAGEQPAIDPLFSGSPHPGDAAASLLFFPLVAIVLCVLLPRRFAARDAYAAVRARRKRKLKVPAAVSREVSQCAERSSDRTELLF